LPQPQQARQLFSLEKEVLDPQVKLSRQDCTAADAVARIACVRN
jgi:hypothetical protein